MIQGTLKKPDGGELVTFDIPTSLSEVPLSRYIDFLIHCREFDQTSATAIAVMAKAVSAFFSVDIQTMLNASAGVFQASESSFAGAVSNLYGHVVKLIKDFKPEIKSTLSSAFTYKGEEYFIPGIVQQAIAGEFVLPDLSVSEVIEVAEISRWKDQVVQNRGDKDGTLLKRINDIAAGQIKAAGGKDPDGAITSAADKVYKMELERAGDPDGSLSFTYYLQTLAVLCRKKDEQLPFEDSVREGWIQNRAFHFQEMDAATALNADFFLTNTLPFSEARPVAVGFLKNHSFAIVAATRLKSEKRSTGRSRIRKKRSRR